MKRFLLVLILGFVAVVSRRPAFAQNGYQQWLPIVTAASEAIEISEFMASNGDTLLDEDGDSSDWIELHRFGSGYLNLAGWYLTDDSAELDKWRFPDVWIGPDEYLTVFASNKNRAVVGAPLHTNFKLGSGGEYLALVEPDGVTVAWELAPAYPPQIRDVSYGLTGKTYRFFQTPTPGQENIVSSADFGPIVADVGHAPTVLYQHDELVVTATVQQTQAPVSAVYLTYRIGFGANQTVAMYDDGANGDGVAGDGVYGARIDSARYGTGDMVRYFVRAVDSSGHDSRWPLYVDADDSAEYLGTVVEDSGLKDPLPRLHLFVEDMDSAETRTGTRATVYYNGKLYDNMFMRVRGLISATYPKKSFKLEFNRGDYFDYDGINAPVKEFNLNTTWKDISYLRMTLAWNAYQQAGVQGSIAFPMRVHANGAFYSVAIFVEQVDETFLERNGLDPDGALYKFRCCNTLDSVTDGVDKKTRLDEGTEDLQAVISGLARNPAPRTTYILDNFNVPSVINYLAATTVIQDYDYIENNYYLYRDTEDSGEWRMLPWDKDKTFGLISAPDHPIYGHPFFGSRDYLYPAPLTRSGHNQLMEAVYNDPLLRQLYLRRLRTVMDEVLSSHSSVTTDRYFETRINTLVSNMSASVAADRALWLPESQPFAEGVDLLRSFLSERRTHLFGTFGPSNRALIPTSQPEILTIQFGDLEPNPASGDQDEEYLTLHNPTDEAIDISGYRLANDIDFVFEPGTVILPDSVLYVSPDVKTFRARADSPTGGENLLVVGDYSRHLHNVGGIVELQNEDGVLVAITFHGTPP